MDGAAPGFDTLIYDVRDHVARITLNRPHRRNALNRQAYDDAIVRARIAQAFGRLIRSKDDRGRFVVLSPAFPSRLLSAFPQGTPVHRLTLDDALQRLQGRVSSDEAVTFEEEPEG